MDRTQLWQNEIWRRAFLRWWDEDWSWEGLTRRFQRKSLSLHSAEKSKTLQELWRDVDVQLCTFGGRQWSRFHLPPFDRDGKPCPEKLWGFAKSQSCLALLESRVVKAAVDGALQKRDSLRAVENYADLRGVVFPNAFDIGDGPLIADLTSTIFLGKFEARNTVLARFRKTLFSADTEFSDATFNGESDFSEVAFASAADFSGVTFQKYADFRGAVFSRAAIFSNVSFFQSAMFTGATFTEYAGFNEATFFGQAFFSGTAFMGYGEFDRATFFRPAMFNGTLPLAAGGSFRLAGFRQGVDFSDREFKAQTSFANAKFGGVLKFHGAKLHPDTSFLNAEFRDGTRGRALPPRRVSWFGIRGRRLFLNSAKFENARHSWKKVLRISLRWKHIPFGLLHPKLAAVRSAHDLDAEKYEIAYRQLRRLSREIGSIEYEGQFHALELRAHRARTDTQVVARLASWLYEVVSDYGRSLSRPLAVLSVFWAVSAVFYRLIFMPPYYQGGAGVDATHCKAIWSPPPISEVIVTAAREFMPSIFGMSSNANRPDWLRCAEGAHPLLFFFMGGFQIILFITCVALFLIALRRRFQLKE